MLPVYLFFFLLLTVDYSRPLVQRVDCVMEYNQAALVEFASASDIEGLSRMLQRTAKALKARAALSGAFWSDVKQDKTGRITMRMLTTKPCASEEDYAMLSEMLTGRWNIELRAVNEEATADNTLPLAAHEEWLECAGDALTTPLAVSRSGLSLNNALTARARKSNYNDITIDVTFNKADSALLAEMTRASMGKRIAVVMNGQVISSPRVMQEITGGRLMVPLVLDLRLARVIAAYLIIPSVRLPLPLNTLSVYTPQMSGTPAAYKE